MNVEMFSNPLTITMLSIIAVLVLPLIALDRRRSRHSRMLMNSIRSYLRDNVASNATIVVHVQDTPESLVPFLEHLLGFERANIQVIVVTSAKSVVRVRTYQRRFRKHLKVSIVQGKKKTDITRSVHRQASGDYVFESTPETRFSRQFFDHLSLEFLDSNIEAVAIHSVVALDNRLTIAASAWTSAVRSIGIRLKLIKPRTYVYRKTAWLEKTSEPASPQSRAMIVAPVDSKLLRLGKIAGFVTIVSIAIAAALAYMFFPITRLYVPMTLYVGVLMVLAAQLSSLPYSGSQKALLMLILPFWPLLSLLPTRQE